MIRRNTSTVECKHQNILERTADHASEVILVSRGFVFYLSFVINVSGLNSASVRHSESYNLLQDTKDSIAQKTLMNVPEICFCVGQVLVLIFLAASDVNAQKGNVVPSVLMTTHAP
jgi:hypothetical protein